MNNVEKIYNLLDFAPLIQLAAGFYLVFIAIEYKHSFAALLSEHLGNFKQQLNFRYASFEIPDCEFDDFAKREHYQMGIGKKALEQTKAKQEHLDSLIKNKKETVTDYIDKVCRCDVFRYLSIYMFVYCLVILFVSGLMKVHFMTIFKYIAYYSLFSEVVVLISVVMSFFIHVINKHSFLWLVATIATVLISIVVSSWCTSNLHFKCDLVSELVFRNYTVISTVILPYLTFLLYILLFVKNSYAIREKGRQEEEDIERIFNEVRNEINDMKGQVKQEEREKALLK